VDVKFEDEKKIKLAQGSNERRKGRKKVRMNINNYQ
jgi:hypothetical protein